MVTGEKLRRRRAFKEARYIISNDATLQETADKFDVAVSTVHRDVTVRMKGINSPMHTKVKSILERHHEEVKAISG